MSPAGIISAAPDEVAHGVEDPAAGSGAGGAPDPDVVSILNVKWIGGKLYQVELAAPGLGRRIMLIHENFADIPHLAISVAAMRALYTR